MKTITVMTQAKGYTFICAERFSNAPQINIGELPKAIGKYCVIASERDGLEVTAKNIYSDAEVAQVQIALHLASEELQKMRSGSTNYNGKKVRDFHWEDELRRMQNMAPRT